MKEKELERLTNLKKNNSTSVKKMGKTIQRRRNKRFKSDCRN